MNPALEIPETLDLIFTNFDPLQHSRAVALLSGGEMLESLAFLARVCKAFQNPALNILWESQSSLVPALRCLPDDLWDRSVDRKKETFVIFARALAPSDWDRPGFYWGRIRKLHLHSFNTSEISREVWELLRICCPNPQLFPNVQQMVWYEPKPSRFPVITAFLSPLVHSITIFPQESAAHLSVLAILARQCPNLTHVDLRTESHPLGHKFADALALFFPDLHRLQSLFIPNLHGEIFRLVAQIPSLKVLDVTEFTLSGPLERSSKYLKPQFPALEDLSLWSTTPNNATAILRAVKHHGLISLNVVFERDFPNANGTAKLFAAVAANGSFPTLRTIQIEDVWAYAANQPNFEELRVTSAVHCQCQHDVTIPTRVTLLGVRALATHCREMHTLELGFDASVVPALGASGAQTSLTTLNAHCPVVSSPIAVARFFRALFPKLTDARTDCSNTGGWNKMVSRLKGRQTDYPESKPLLTWSRIATHIPSGMAIHDFHSAVDFFCVLK
ncbi:hypothetical protein C8R47DRAFT_1168289 [Mycena vitilis]|nr:hypothetical protein C8R47DRAFT_1168289 [Mycena vitilis]